MKGEPFEVAAEFVRGQLPLMPVVAVVLGSGLNDFFTNLENRVVVPYDQIPHFPLPTAPGHVGRFVFGSVLGLPIIIAEGRFHYYEGYPLELVTLPIRLFARLGVQTVILTNAVGCVSPDWQVGDLMLITGHLDYSFITGTDDPKIHSGKPYYSSELLSLARQAAKDAGISLREGVYAWCLGPTFETPAEIREIRNLGGQVIGMSTVPEIRAAVEHGLKVLGISCVTNYGAGVANQSLNHEEVLPTGRRVRDTFARLLLAILAGLAD